MSEEQNLAGLLLLGCLVGAIMFMCFAMATLNLVASKEEAETPLPDVPALISQRDDLIVQQKTVQGDIKKLKDDIEYISGKTVQAAKQVAALQKTQAFDHSQEIDKIRKEIDATEKEKQDLLDKIQEKKRDVDKFNVWREIGGTIRFKNPLFLECRGRIVMVHPGKKVLNMSDLNKKNSLQSYTQGCDGIVLLVRPDGFGAFLAAFIQAKKIGLKLAYEPVDAAWQLDFAKGQEK